VLFGEENRYPESVCLAESSVHLTERVLVVEDHLLKWKRVYLEGEP